MSKSNDLKAFIREYIEYFDYDGGTGANLDFPDFELLPHSFLEFADKELAQKEVEQHLINSITHLKRAAECQIDTFLYVCNLYKIVNKSNLGFDAKLKFLKDVQVFNSRTLSRFNTIRNKIEHEYAIPQIEDIEVYHDLVSALIEVIEGAMFILARGANIVFSIEQQEKIVGYFEMTYQFEEPSIKVRYSLNEEEATLIATFSKEREEFIFFLKVLILLNKSTCLINSKWVLNEL